jgi:hypothetical protein
MKRMLMVAIVLACSVEAHAQEVNGWHRDTPLRQQWRADYAACVAASTKGKPVAPPPETQTPLGLSMGLSPFGPIDGNKLTACMNAKGWFR